jgi:hypothetical protein
MKLQQRSIPFYFAILSLALCNPKAVIVLATIDCGELPNRACPQTLRGNNNTFLCDEDADECYFQSIRGVEGIGSVCKSTPIPLGTKMFLSSLIQSTTASTNTSNTKSLDEPTGGLVCLRTKIFFKSDLDEPHGMMCVGNTACQDATIVTGPKGFVICQGVAPDAENSTSIATAACTSSGYLFPDTEIGAMVINAGCLQCIGEYGCGENVVFIDAGKPGNEFQIVDTNFTGFLGSGCPTPPEAGYVSCFSPSNTVQVDGKGIIPIQDLQIGDYVKSSTTNNEYSRVVSFMHKDLHAEVIYLQIYTDRGNESPLEITPEHFLFLSHGKLVTARDLRVGDILDTDQGKQMVTTIHTVYRRGMLAPLTESGNVVVSGVHASCYVALLQDHRIAPTTLQAIVLHATLTPLRLTCALDFSICQKESYTSEGLSTNIEHLIQFGFRLFELNGTIQLLVLIIALPLLIVQTALEILFDHSFMVLFVAGLTVLYKSVGKKPAEDTKIRPFWVERQICEGFCYMNGRRSTLRH